MKKYIRLLFLIGPIAGVIAGIFIEREIINPLPEKLPQAETALEHAKKHLAPTYVCPMHSEMTSKEKGTCPICGMKLVPVKQGATDVDTGTHPEVVISPAIMNNLGVRTIKLERQSIARRIEIPGFVQQIKKGQMSYYSAPFKGVITRHLFERNHWYENSGEPLVELESDELLNAQQEHLQLFQQSDATAQPAVIAGTPHSKSTERETTPQAEKVDIMTLSDDDDNVSEFLNGDGTLKEDYRDQLIKMGHDDNSIAEIEKEMQSMQKKPANKPLPETTTPSPALSTSKTAPTGVASTNDSTTLTLEDSRKRLQSLGMREKDIKLLETGGSPTSKLIMYSNQPGRVLDMTAGVGEPVEKGQLLFKLGGEVRAVVVANAFQRDAAWISTGQRVEVRMPHEGGVIWPGIVNQGAVSINPDSQNIGIRLTFTAPLDKVRSNMYVVSTIYGSVTDNVIAVPSQAIIRTEGEDRVIKALGDGRFVPVNVKVGVETGEESEIVEGLDEGDEVVVMSQFLIDSESNLQASMQRLSSQ